MTPNSIFLFSDEDSRDHLTSWPSSGGVGASTGGGGGHNQICCLVI